MPIRIDDAFIAGNPPLKIVDPVMRAVDIYNGEAAYRASLEKFSQAQRDVFAVLWYWLEVDNGGHHQFYYNSTGLVWSDAGKGLDAVGLPEGADILRATAQRFGRPPPFDWTERQDLLLRLRLNFDDLDDAYAALEDRIDTHGVVTDYIRARPAQFHFDGEVPVPKR